MGIETSLGELYASVKRAPVEIRNANAALISRGSVATLEEGLQEGSRKGDFSATVTLPTGQQIIRGIGQHDSQQGALDDLAQSIRAALARPVTGSEPTAQADAPFCIRLFEGVMDDTRAITLPTPPAGDAELSLTADQAILHNRAANPRTLQIAQAGFRTLNIMVPPGCAVKVRAGPEPFRSRIATKFGVDLVDDLIDLRRGGLLSEATGVAQTLKVKDVLDIAQDHPAAAVAAVYIMLRSSDFKEAADAIGALASRGKPGVDLLLLQAELEARRGNDREAEAAFLSAARQGLPMFSTGLSYLVDRLRMYMQSAGPAGAGALKESLVMLQRVAARCDFNVVFTNYTGASPASPGDEVFDTTAPAQPPAIQVGGLAKENMMSNQFVTQEQIDQLAKALASPELEAQGIADFKKKFCEVWPACSQGLSALQGILALVPAVSALAVPAVGIVRAAGAAAAQSCPKE